MGWGDCPHVGQQRREGTDAGDSAENAGDLNGSRSPNWSASRPPVRAPSGIRPEGLTVTMFQMMVANPFSRESGLITDERFGRNVFDRTTSADWTYSI